MGTEPNANVFLGRLSKGVDYKQQPGFLLT